MTTPVVEDAPQLSEDLAAQPAQPSRRRPTAVLRNGWVPAVLVAAATAVALRFYGVPLTSSLAFGAYLVLGIALPGTLVWRALYRGRSSFAADAAAGLALGYAGEMFAYIPARAVGLPLLVLAWPVGTVALFLAVPKLRRYWRSEPTGRPPALWSWSIAAAIGAVVFWSFKFFRVYGLKPPFYTSPDIDSPFHLAMLGEAKHHMPLTTPWIADEPARYHWFVYADMAATSWVTGIEPQVLLLRLSMLPMLAAFVVLVAALARKLFGHWWTGVAAVVVTMFVLAPSPHGWPLPEFYTKLGFSAVDDGSALRLTVWACPTQTFGAVLFVPAVLVLVDLLWGDGSWRRWLLFGVLLAAAMGGKATYLPLMLAGLLTVLGAQVVLQRRLQRRLNRRLHRRLYRPALLATGITLACIAFAQVVLFGGASQGLKWQPLLATQTSGIQTTGFLSDPQPWRLAVVTMVFVWCWVCVWAGISGLLRQRRLMAPEILLLLGIGAAGVGATMLLGQPGDSQRFFIESGRPYLALAAVGGLAAVLQRRTGDGPATQPDWQPVAQRQPGDEPAWRLDRRTGVALVGAAVVGALTIFAIRELEGPTIPQPANIPGPKHLALAVVWPYALTFAVAVCAVVGLAIARRRVAVLRGTSHALVIALLAGFGLATTYSNFSLVVEESSAKGWRDVPPAAPIITTGTLEAGRWLRDNSDPDDVVATNAHCVGPTTFACFNMHFAIAAYTERRMLVEGWGFTASAHEQAAALGTWYAVVPYWKPEVLAANDAVFTAPSSAAVSVLRDRYGVRWLFVDETVGKADGLSNVAQLRYRSGDCAVYQII